MDQVVPPETTTNDETQAASSLVIVEVFEARKHNKLSAGQQLVTVFDGEDMYQVGNPASLLLGICHGAYICRVLVVTQETDVTGSDGSARAARRLGCVCGMRCPPDMQSSEKFLV